MLIWKATSAGSLVLLPSFPPYLGKSSLRPTNPKADQPTLRYFYLPETKGRALEEINACFEEGIPARKFEKFISTGAAGRIAGYESAGGIHADDMEAQRKAEAMQMENMGHKGAEATEQEPRLGAVTTLT